MAYSKESMAEEILIDLYNNKFIETIFNTKDHKHYEGWFLKSKIFSPYYVNLRNIGNRPDLAKKIGYAMNSMIREEIPNINLIIGVDMAGIPLAGIIGTTMPYIKFAYTRPLPGTKVRTPEEAKERLAKIESSGDWGSHQLLEGKLENNQNICIVDDVVSDLGSKLISREVILSEVKRLGLENVNCSEIAVVLDREQGAEEKAKKEGLKLHSLIKFKMGLPLLKEIMHPLEYEIITAFNDTPEAYQYTKYRIAAAEVSASYRER